MLYILLGPPGIPLLPSASWPADHQPASQLQDREHGIYIYTVRASGCCLNHVSILRIASFPVGLAAGALTPLNTLASQASQPASQPGASFLVGLAASALTPLNTLASQASQPASQPGASFLVGLAAKLY